MEQHQQRRQKFLLHSNKTVGGRSGWGMFNNSGEGADSTHVGLPGVQEELVRAVYAANPNMVIAHTDARPLVSEWAYETASSKWIVFPRI